MTPVDSASPDSRTLYTEPINMHDTNNQCDTRSAPRGYTSAEALRIAILFAIRIGSVIIVSLDAGPPVWPRPCIATTEGSSPPQLVDLPSLRGEREEGLAALDHKEALGLIARRAGRWIL